MGGWKAFFAPRVNCRLTVALISDVRKTQLSSVPLSGITTATLSPKSDTRPMVLRVSAQELRRNKVIYVSSFS